MPYLSYPHDLITSKYFVKTANCEDCWRSCLPKPPVRATHSLQSHVHKNFPANFLSKSLTRIRYLAHLKRCVNLTSSSKFIYQNPTGFKARCTVEFTSWNKLQILFLFKMFQSISFDVFTEHFSCSLVDFDPLFLYRFTLMFWRNALSSYSWLTEEDQLRKWR